MATLGLLAPEIDVTGLGMSIPDGDVTPSAAAGSGSIGYMGGTLAASSTCTVSADVTSSTVGTHVNTSGDLTSSAGNSGMATATLPVVDTTFRVPATTGTGPITGSVTGGGGQISGS